MTIVGSGHAYSSWKSPPRALEHRVDELVAERLDVGPEELDRPRRERPAEQLPERVCSGGSFTSPAGFVYCGLWP